MNNTIPVNKQIRWESVLEMTALIMIGYLVFIVLTGNIGFLLGLPVTPFTLPISFIMYALFLVGGYALFRPGGGKWHEFALAFFAFQIITVMLAFIAYGFFSHMYDTSWDGEGYHSNAVISIAAGWNPVYQKDLPVKFPDASIFVKGYPKALWLIQSSIYLAAGDFDAAKVTNLAAVLIALLVSYSFFRKIKLSVPLASLLSAAAALHPPFLIQLFSYSADLFSYEMVIVAVSSLGMFCAENNINKNLLVFTLAELLLVGSKFSNLPVAGILGVMFVFIFITVKIDSENDRINWVLAAALLAVSVVFAFVPYATNYIHFKHPFYPSNYESVNRTFRQDNVPKNLMGASNPELLFYSIFSRSQVKPMGKNDPQNTASLKIPFSFSTDEILQSSSIYNNRVGAAGPLFSGIFTIAVLALVLAIVRTGDRGNRLPLYGTGGLLAVCIMLTVFNPVPNLLRYNVQVVLIPFIVFISVLLFFRDDRLLRLLAYAGIGFMLANMLLFTGGIIWKNFNEQTEINSQLAMLRDPSYRTVVWANNFYSNYLRLDEAKVPYTIDRTLPCRNVLFLSYSSYTTRMCRLPAIRQDRIP